MLTICKECKNMKEATDWIRSLENKENFKEFKIYLKWSSHKKCYVTKIVGNIDI